jgi:hypothetical protein
MKYAPFMVGIHCMAHRTNLASKVLSKIKLVRKVEYLVQDVYTYFARSPKCYHEYQMIAKGISDGLKLLHVVGTRWMSLYKPTLHIFKEYRSIMSKMDNDAPKNLDAFSIYDLMSNMDMVIGIPCILPMLEEMH